MEPKRRAQRRKTDEQQQEEQKLQREDGRERERGPQRRMQYRRSFSRTSTCAAVAPSYYKRNVYDYEHAYKYYMNINMNTT